MACDGMAFPGVITGSFGMIILLPFDMPVIEVQAWAGGAGRWLKEYCRIINSTRWTLQVIAV